MSKLTKRKSEQIGGKMPTAYELNKEAKEKALTALELAKSQNKPVKYLINKTL